MNLAILGFNFENSSYLVFDKDTKKALIMSAADLAGHNISEAIYADGQVKPIYPESKYFIPDLYSETSPQLQGYLIEEVIPGRYSVYTNQKKIVAMTAQQVSKLFTILSADLTFPNGEPKVNILHANTIPAVNLGPVKMQSTDSPILRNNASPVSQTTEELLNIFRQDIKGICVTTERGWPLIHQYRNKDVLEAMKVWITQDYPELQSFFNYFLKYPMLYPPEGNTPLLRRKSYIYAMYRLLKAQIVYTTAIKEIKQGAKVPSLPLVIRTLTHGFSWERKLLSKLPAEQRIPLEYIASPKSIDNANTFCRTTNVCFLLGYSTSKQRSAGDYTMYNDKLYQSYMRRIAKLKREGTSVVFEGLDSESYLQALATLKIKCKPKNYTNYCFIKMPTGEYIKLTRPRRAADFGVVKPKVELVQRPEYGIATYDLGKVRFISEDKIMQVLEMLLFYANRTVNHYEYSFDNNNITLHNISKNTSHTKKGISGLEDFTSILEYMYS
jgi:hypothetical protein